MNDFLTQPAMREDFLGAIARLQAGSRVDLGIPPAAAVLDREAFDRQRATFGDERTLRFLAMLADELERRLAAIDEALGRQARTDLGQHAHAIASAAGNLGFRHLMELGRFLERQMAELSPEQLDAAVAELRRSLTDAVVTIAALRAELEAAAAGSAPPDRV